MTMSLADCMRISRHSIAQRICHAAARRGVPLQDMIDHAPLLNIRVVSRYIGCDMRDILPEAPGMEHKK